MASLSDLRKEALKRQFGVDFESGAGGLVNCDQNCKTVFDLISVLDLGFCWQMTGWLDFWVEICVFYVGIKTAEFR